MTSLRKEKEKKENEFDNFNATLTDLKKEQLIYEIKNKMLEQMVRRRRRRNKMKAATNLSCRN